MIFGIDLSTLNIGLMKSGSASWQEVLETRNGFNTVLILQEQEIVYLRASSSRSFRPQSH